MSNERGNRQQTYWPSEYDGGYFLRNQKHITEDTPNYVPEGKEVSNIPIYRLVSSKVPRGKICETKGHNFQELPKAFSVPDASFRKCKRCGDMEQNQ